MLANVLILAFVSAFVALCLYGHFLLIVAIWPNLFPNRSKASFDPIAESDPSLNQTG